MGVGANIGNILNERKMSVAKLARAADVPVGTLYAAINRDTKSMDTSTVVKIAKALDVAPADIDPGISKGIHIDLLDDSEKAQIEDLISICTKLNGIGLGRLQEQARLMANDMRYTSRDDKYLADVWPEALVAEYRDPFLKSVAEHIAGGASVPEMSLEDIEYSQECSEAFLPERNEEE